MSNTTKIVFIGAGSMSFGLSMFRDICFAENLKGSTLALVDTDPGRLARMTELARLLNKKSGAGLSIEHTIDRRAALAASSSMRRRSTAIGSGSSTTKFRRSTAFVTRSARTVGPADCSLRCGPCRWSSTSRATWSSCARTRSSSTSPIPKAASSWRSASTAISVR